MTTRERQALSGRLTIELRLPDGRVVIRQQHDNLITTAGKQLVAQMFTGEVVGKPELRIAVGGSIDDPRPGDTKLGKQLDEAPATTDKISLVPEDGAQRALATVTAQFPALGEGLSQELHEAGIVIRFLNQAAVLYNRVSFASITRTGNLEMTLSWEVLF